MTHLPIRLALIVLVATNLPLTSRADGNVVFPGNTAVIPVVWRWTDDSHRSASLRGRCVVGREQSPCHRVEVQLTDPHGQLLARTYTASDGTFSFPARPEAIYRLRVASDRYEFATQDNSDLRRGDQATLLLMPRRGPASLAKLKF
jgi:hypothetical protein